MTRNRYLSAVVSFALALLALFSLTGPAAAQEGAWWNPDWGYRKAVTVDTSPSGVNVSGAIGRTVVLVRLHGGNFSFTDALENGADLRFVDSDNKTPLPFHIEQYDSSADIATIWVSVPNLNGGEQRRIWLYFANANAPAGADAPATFDADYAAVYHFSDGTGEPASDATANANASQNAPAGLNPNGIIGSSARFPGQGALQIAASGSLAMPAGAAMTFTTWIKPEQLAGQQTVLQRGALTIGLNGGAPFVQIGGQVIAAETALAQGEWSHLAVAADGTTVRIYVNGVEAGAASIALPALDGDILLGGGTTAPFTGELDEARISKSARPAAMLLAMAQAESAEGTLVVVDEGAEEPSEGSGVLGFIISKVPLLDAIVIFICLILLAIAAAVMISKIRYVNKASKANQQFLRRYSEMQEDLVPLAQVRGLAEGEREYLQASPLGRIYETGMEEWNLRRRNGGGQTLSSQAVAAMRAAGNSVLVEENQKLDRWMVILTIAISGGPFIGLLGTVMGVMGTFGGVAMAGDVNVNAIAPGIAAALLATIAGLACAIPALFGYNYLNSRITPLADEMNVFIDRLITRIAEIQHDQAARRPMAPAN